MLRRTLGSAVRAPAVAGLFYPADAAELRDMVAGFLGPVPAHAERAPKAVIAPHAGFIYSGPVAGSCFGALRLGRESIRRVILIGPSHRVPFSGIALPSSLYFETPLGQLTVDQDALAAIAGYTGVCPLDIAHAQEHSLETHLPFLQLALDHFSIVPLVIGDVTHSLVARVLDKLWGGDETFISVSSDLSHYLDYEAAKQLDAETTRAIESMDPGSIAWEQACGRTGIQALLLCAKKRGLKVRTLDQRNSGDTAGPRDSVVGYGAYAFY